MIGDVYGTGLFFMVIAREKIVLEIPGKNGCRVRMIFPPAQVGSFPVDAAIIS